MKTLNIGDIVTLKNIRPRYMEGARGIITARSGTKFMVRLSDGLKFRGRSSEVKVPASCITRLPVTDDLLEES
jgi:hypothetical protein